MIPIALADARRPSAGLGARAAGALLLLLAATTLGCGDDVHARLEAAPTRLELPHGGWVPVRFTITPEQELAGGGAPYLFVHLMGEDGVLRTFDQPLRGRWEVGTALTQEVRVHQSLVGPALPAGEYALTAGVYQLDGERLSLATDGRRRGNAEYEVATVVVPAKSVTPQARFSDAFLPVEVGRDRQILGRRYASGEAFVTLRNVPAAGILWLTVNVPAAVAGESDLVLAEGRDQPGVQVETTCAETRAALVGPGVHSVDLPMAGGRAECEVRLIPDFELVESEGGRELGPALEILAWAPAAIARPAAPPAPRSE